MAEFSLLWSNYSDIYIFFYPYYRVSLLNHYPIYSMHDRDVRHMSLVSDLNKVSCAVTIFCISGYWSEVCTAHLMASFIFWMLISYVPFSLSNLLTLGFLFTICSAASLLCIQVWSSSGFLFAYLIMRISGCLTY